MNVAETDIRDDTFILSNSNILVYILISMQARKV